MKKNVSKYINNIVRNSNLSTKDKNDLKECLYSSYYENLNTFILNGDDDDTAQEKALNSLGSENDLDDNVYSVPRLAQNISIVILTVWLLFIMLKYLKDYSYDMGFFRYPLQAKYFIPFGRVFEVISNYHQGDFLSVFDEYIVLVFFIPVGILVPLATNKLNNIRYNLKAFLLITFAIEVIKYAFLIKRPHIDYIFFSFIFCCIGYYLLKAILVIKDKLNLNK